jgi:hypothetical protein
VREKSAGEEAAHDILAAEAFAVPAPDPRLRHNLVFPDDPTGIAVAHDILAAEEFAMPAPEAGPGAERVRASAHYRWAATIGTVLLGYWIVRGRRR